MANQVVDGIEVQIGVNSGNYSKELDILDKEVEKKVENTSKKASKQLEDISKGLAKTGGALTLGLTTPIIAFGKNAIDSANALEVVGRRTNIIYGDMTSEVQAWSFAHEDAFGLGAGTIENYVGNIGE